MRSTECKAMIAKRLEGIKMNEEMKPVESNDIPKEWQEAISARRNRRAAETIVAEPVKDACMDYARRGWRMAYIMTAVAGAAVGLCAWLVGVVV